MSDETANQPTAGNPQQGEGQPTMVVNAQYVKDLSFENPNAPRSLQQSDQAPNVQVGVDTAVVQLQGSTYEVVLTVRAEGTAGENSLFLVEVAYAGVFTIGEVPQEYVAPLLYVEAPRQLFPFARAIVADCVRDGGFPPLLIHPIDFMALFQQKAAEAAQAAGGEGAPEGESQPGEAQQNESGSDKPGGKDNGGQKFEFEL